ncbi:MAG: nucleoside-diphosphate sugar epimerase/dehydratase [Caldilineaceae bacterium]
MMDSIRRFAVWLLPKVVNMTFQIRNRHIFVADLAVLVLLPFIAMSLRLETLHWSSHRNQVVFFFLLIALLVKLPIFYHFGFYRRYWRYANLSDLTTLSGAILLASVVLTGLFAGLHSWLGQHGLAIERTVPLIDGLLTLIAILGVRLSLRFIYEWHRQYHSALKKRNVLIVGAGSAGTLALKEIQANPALNMWVVGFIDDDPAKIGTQLQGTPVLGSCCEIAKLVDQTATRFIIIAMPSVALPRRREIIALCRQTAADVLNLPGVYELIAGRKSISALPKVDVDKLLNRPPIVIDQSEVTALVQGETVLVTGAGGSIGGELCRQIAHAKPGLIVLLGHGENSIFEIGLELRIAFPDVVTHQVIADVRDQKRMMQIVRTLRPRVIFHAAAHKHVPFMESALTEAITNNVQGTWNVLRAAEEGSVERFVLISSDKAINPTSIMGATKRIAELLVQAAARRTGRAYMAVRFGNVLGSRGSVIPIFQRQLAAGGPLTITHPEMTRYFMTIPEAVQLVLQASVLGRGSEVFVLDMGAPVKILELATRLLEMSGLQQGRDVEVIYTGIRPGEKLKEELFFSSEAYQRTKHEKIFVATEEAVEQGQLLSAAIERLITLAEQQQPEAARQQLKLIVPQYKPAGERLVEAPEASEKVNRISQTVPQFSVAGT